MRILHTFSFLSPNANGTITLIRHLSLALTQKGHEVGIFTSDFELTKKYVDSLLPVKIYEYPSWLNLQGLYLYMSPGIVSEAKRIIGDFDIVHLHCFRSLQNMVVCHYAKKYGIPYVLDTHGSLPRLHGGRGCKWLLRCLFDMFFGYRILRDASKVIAETEVGVDEYKEFGVDQDKIVLISPPFSTEEFSQLPPPGIFRQKYGIEEKPIIMFLGRIHWIKGLDFLVKSFHELTKVRDDAILVIVGPDDGYKPALDKLIKKLGLADRVLFTGFLGGQEKLSALVDADVVIQTSVYEQGAGVPFEAVLCNTPIIVSSNSGAGENVKGIDAGYLVEYGNNLELRNMIQYVLANPAEAHAKTQKAKNYIETNLSMTSGVEKYTKVYTEVTERLKR